MNKTTPDRRSTERYSLRIPLHLRIWGSSDPERIAESVDLSGRGVLLETDYPLRVGSVVDLQLKLPEEITAQPTTEWRCRGHVVRVVAHATLNGSLRAGVHFDRLNVSGV